MHSDPQHCCPNTCKGECSVAQVARSALSTSLNMYLQVAWGSEIVIIAHRAGIMTVKHVRIPAQLVHRISSACEEKCMLIVLGSELVLVRRRIGNQKHGSVDESSPIACYCNVLGLCVGLSDCPTRNLRSSRGAAPAGDRCSCLRQHTHVANVTTIPLMLQFEDQAGRILPMPHPTFWARSQDGSWRNPSRIRVWFCRNSPWGFPKGLTRHVGAGHEVEAGAVGEVGVVGLEGVLRRRLRHRVPPAYNGDRPCAHLVGSFRQSPSQPLAATAAEASA